MADAELDAGDPAPLGLGTSATGAVPQAAAVISARAARATVFIGTPNVGPRRGLRPRKATARILFQPD